MRGNPSSKLEINMWSKNLRILTLIYEYLSSNRNLIDHISRQTHIIRASQAAEKRLEILKQKARKIETMTGTEDPSELRNCGLASPVVNAVGDPLNRPVRPVATPVRAPERAVSTDAQPRSQQLWEAAFPGPVGDEVAKEPAAVEADLAAGGPTPGKVGQPTATAESTAAQPEDSDDELIMDVDCVASQQVAVFDNIYIYIHI